MVTRPLEVVHDGPVLIAKAGIPSSIACLRTRGLKYYTGIVAFLIVGNTIYSINQTNTFLDTLHCEIVVSLILRNSSLN